MSEMSNKEILIGCGAVEALINCCASDEIKLTTLNALGFKNFKEANDFIQAKKNP